MAILKFDQVTAPDFTGVSSILNNASSMLSKAGDSATQLIKDFNQSREEKAKSELLSNLYKASPEDILNFNGNYLLTHGDKDYLNRISANNLLSLFKEQSALKDTYFKDRENKSYNSILYDFYNTPEKNLYSSKNPVFSKPETKEDFNNLSTENASKLMELYNTNKTAYLNKQLELQKLEELKRQFDINNSNKLDALSKIDAQNKAYSTAATILESIPENSLRDTDPISLIPKEILNLLSPEQINSLIDRKDLRTTSAKDTFASNQSKLVSNYLDEAIKKEISPEDILSNPIYIETKRNLSEKDSARINALEKDIKNSYINREAKNYLSNLDNKIRTEGYSNRIAALGDKNFREEFESLPQEIKDKIIELDPQFKNYNSNPEYIILSSGNRDTYTFPIGSNFTKSSQNKAQSNLEKATKEQSKEKPSPINFDEIDPTKREVVKNAFAYFDQEGIDYGNPLGEWNYPTFKPEGSSSRIYSPARTEEGRKLIDYMMKNRNYEFLKEFSPEERDFIMKYGDNFTSSSDLPSIDASYNVLFDPITRKATPNLYKTNSKIRDAVKYYVDHRKDYTITLPKEYYSKVATDNKASSLLEGANKPATVSPIPENTGDVFIASAEDLVNPESEQSKLLQTVTDKYINERQKRLSKLEDMARSWGTSTNELSKVLSSDAPTGAKAINTSIESVISTLKSDPKGASKGFIEDVLEDTDSLRSSLKELILSAQQQGIPPALIESFLLKNISENNVFWGYLTGDALDGSSADSKTMQEGLKNVNALKNMYMQTMSDLTKLDKKSKVFSELSSEIEKARLLYTISKAKGNAGDQRRAIQLIDNFINNNQETLRQALTSIY